MTSPTLGALLPAVGRDVLRLPSTGTAITLGLGGAAALFVRPSDHRISRHNVAHEETGEGFAAGSSLGSGWVQVGAAFGTMFIGQVSHHSRMQALGFDLTRAQLVNSIMTQGLKVTVNRQRPDGAAYSFPSGHASASFATATVLQRHFGWKVGGPAYAAATYVAGSRVQQNLHFTSDVIFGAALGIVAGRTVTIGHGANRFAVAPMVGPNGGAGVAITRVDTH